MSRRATGCISVRAGLTGEMGTGALFGVIFVLSGLAFKISAVPFHMWTPDVYEGAPLPVTAFLATVSKAGMVAVALRLLLAAEAFKFGEVTVVLSLRGMSAAQAVAAARFHHQLLPPRRITYSRCCSLPDSALVELRSRGYEPVRNPWEFGDLQMIRIDANGKAEAASDPRGRGASD